MGDYTIILNPVAGKGHGASLEGPVRAEFERRGFRYTLQKTEGRAHATELARAATTEIIVAVGGDGTVNEVANGLVGSKKALGVLPAGSGNDFIKAAKIPRKLPRAFEVLFRENVYPIDVGFVKTSDQKGRGVASERHFVNGVGVGFDAAVAAKTAEIRFLTGVPLYLAAVFQTLGRFTAPHFKMEMDGSSMESTNLLVAIGNGPCAGGGFYLTPDAIIDDGRFDVCLIEDVTILTILRLMPRVMLGKHRNAKQAKFLRVREIYMEAETPFYVHADGEIAGRDVTGVRISMQEKALRIIGGR